MIRINSFSDIHLEFYDINNLPELRLSDNLDLLFILGDTIKGSKSGIQPQYKEWLLNLSKKANYLIYVPGNHEYYSNRRDKFIREFRKTFENTNIILLVNETFIYKDLKLIGTDLWSDYQYTPTLLDQNTSLKHKYFLAENNIYDFRFINVKENNFRKLLVKDVLNWNTQAKNFIFEELNKNDGYRNILLTHFGLITETLSDFDKENEYSFHDTNDLKEELFDTANPPIYLFSGHSHQFKHEKINNNCFLFMNCGGYNHTDKKGVNYLIKDFKSDYLIEV